MSATPEEAHLITVDELIERLSALTPEQRAMPAWVEGCDCAGPAIGVDVESEFVIVTRGQEVWDDDLDRMIWRPMND